ncbi:dermatan-sulfate epimerase-like protein [Lineus longissimus]|uniref:dermatan-sulfate epimerase-like protein n=1 Tax=Lineus longissimus TaxID=88925 RepID=UPI00315D3130
MTPFMHYALSLSLLVLTNLMQLSRPQKLDHQSDVTKTNFPMLFFEARDIVKYRIAANTTHQDITKDLKRARDDFLQKPSLFIPPVSHELFGSRWNERYGNNLPVMAFYCLLYPEDEKAFKFVEVSMDRMASYPNWLVASAPTDEVPVSHSLLGFATAYDFLFPRFGRKKQQLYTNKILTVTKGLYHASFSRWWGHSYIQNHVATNLLALLVGGLVSKPHDAKASVWIKRAVGQFERTMFLLNQVKDGSLNEAVSYGSYTMRSLSQYAHIVSRHFGISHFQSPWLQEHFWFYYATTLPGYYRSVGIADSCAGWWYGPESQLVFLDRFVMRNGSGNWLAKAIRENKAKHPYLLPGPSQMYSTLHTEFIWYDPTLGATPPLAHGENTLHVFSDWGVVTYGYSTDLSPVSTFLSFKSGKKHGTAVYDMAHGLTRRPPWLSEGWRNFNPGHEHPDQNSFTFSPNGVPFITEGLYANKFTYLDNVLMFHPSDSSSCTPSWGGQAGDCGKWLGLQDEDSKHARGEILSVKQKDNTVYLEGEAAKSYPSKMGLLSWRRHLVLLNPDALLVIDNVRLTRGSNLTHASAFFNNYQYKFNKTLGNGFHLNLTEGRYQAVYTTGQGQTPTVHFSYIRTEDFRRTVSNANVTFELEGNSTWIAFVLSSPRFKASNLHFNLVDPKKVTLKLSSRINSYTLNIERGKSDLLGSQFSVEVSTTFSKLSKIGRGCDTPLVAIVGINVTLLLMVCLLFRKRRFTIIRLVCLLIVCMSQGLILTCKS